MLAPESSSFRISTFCSSPSESSDTLHGGSHFQLVAPGQLLDAALHLAKVNDRFHIRQEKSDVFRYA